MVEDLFAAGRLREDHVRAAQEIRRVWALLGRAFFPATSRWGHHTRRRGPVSAGDVTGPLERFGERDERVYRLRYLPWARELSRPGFVGRGRLTGLQLVIDMVIDNRGPRQTETQHGLRHGTAVAALQLALHRYSCLAGWIEERPATAAPVAGRGTPRRSAGSPSTMPGTGVFPLAGKSAIRQILQRAALRKR
ncbi:MAG: hypothetical protein RIE31_05075 [Alphaproteobacteria bacterium]